MDSKIFIIYFLHAVGKFVPCLNTIAPDKPCAHSLHAYHGIKEFAYTTARRGHNVHVASYISVCGSGSVGFGLTIGSKLALLTWPITFLVSFLALAGSPAFNLLPAPATPALPAWETLALPSPEFVVDLTALSLAASAKYLEVVCAAPAAWVWR